MIRYIIFLWFSSLAMGQTTWEFGISYGNSDILRNDSPNFYNYSNYELGGFAQRNKAFKNVENQIWKKYWNLEGNIILSDYEHLLNGENSTELRLNTQIGLSLKFPWEVIDLRLNAKFGPGYHTGYESRLHEGIYFTESISLQVNFNPNSKWSPLVRVGAMHVSNANIYKLNKGLEVIYLKIGWRINSTPSNSL